MPDRTADILIVGGGPAGMAAALAATWNRRSKVTVVDDNPILGGQIWRAELARLRSPDAARLVAAIEAGKITVINNACVFAALSKDRLLAESPDGRIEIGFEKLVIATGARERFLPFPGWTLPNVHGAGGVQALVKSGLDVKGRHVVVAGTGPLLLAVAAYLRSKGAVVAAIAEQARASDIRQFGLGLWRFPSKLIAAAKLRAHLINVPYWTDSWVRSVDGDGHVETVEIQRNGRSMTIRCDILACGFDLVPNTELASMLGCRLRNGFVEVDRFQRTSLENVFCAGEPTGIGGLEVSLAEGKVAGYTASDEKARAATLFNERNRAREFGHALARTFELRDELRTLAENDTIVCRCEDVTFESLQEFTNSRDAKLQTRCGMGPCQGRTCGAANEFLFGWKSDTVRPPIFPVNLENL